MPAPPVHVALAAGRAGDHDDLMVLLRHQESVGGVRLVDEGAEVVHALGWAGARRAAASGAPWVLTLRVCRRT